MLKMKVNTHIPYETDLCTTQWNSPTKCGYFDARAFTSMSNRSFGKQGFTTTLWISFF